MPIIFNVLHWISASVLIFLSCYCLKKSSTKLGLYLCFFLLLLAGWSLSAALIFNLPDLETKIALNRIKLICCALIPVNVFFLVRSLTDNFKLSKVALGTLLIIPAISVLILLSPYHFYFINDYQLQNILGSTILTFSNGPWFTVHNLQTRILLLWSLYLLAKTIFSHNPSQRSYSWAFFFSILLPFVVDSVAVIFFPSMRYLQIVPVALTFSAFVFSYIILKGNVLEIIPMARTLIIDSIPDCYLIFDHNQQLIDFNNFAKKMLSLDDKSYGKTLGQIKLDSNEIVKHLTLYMDTPKNDYQFTVIDNQTPEYFSISSEQIIGKNENFLGKIVIVKNITKQKNYENQLNQVVETRTKFIGIIAHDLIGNVSGHSLFLESLMDHPAVSSDEDLKASLSFLLASSQDITKFVKSLLIWSKENLDKIQLKKTHTSLHLLMTEAINYLRPVAIQKDIEFICDVPQKTLASIDSNMIQTVIRNILANAIRLSPPKSTITIETKEHSQFIEVLISDEGPGVNEEELNQFFGRLGVGSYKGGLGLILCKDFIHLHKGEIKVKNREKQGAIFSFTLPLSPNPH